MFEVRQEWLLRFESGSYVLESAIFLGLTTPRPFHPSSSRHSSQMLSRAVRLGPCGRTVFQRSVKGPYLPLLMSLVFSLRATSMPLLSFHVLVRDCVLSSALCCLFSPHGRPRANVDG